MTPQVSQNVTSTYVGLCEGLDKPTFQQSLSAFLLALDLNGESKFSTRVWQVVTSAFQTHGEGVAMRTLEGFSGLVFRGGADTWC